MFDWTELRIRFFERCNLRWLCWLMFVCAAMNFSPVSNGPQRLRAQDANRTDSELGVAAEKVQALIINLANNSRRVRIDAEEQLLNLGPAVLPLLPEPDEDTDANVRQAVERIRRQLELQKATTIFAASTFTLNGKYSLQDVLEHLSTQTENPIDHSKLKNSLRTKLIVCKFQKTSFWTTITKLAKDNRFSWELKDQKLILIPASSEAALQSFETLSGPTHVSLAEGEMVDIPGSSSVKLWKSIVTISTEPRLQPLVIRYATDNIEASHQKSKLEPFVSGAKYDRVLSVGTRQAVVPIQFRIPQRAGSSALITLKGSIQLVCASPNQTFEVSTRADSEVFRTGSLVLNIASTNFGNRTLSETTAQYRDSPIQFESHLTSVLPGNISLLQNTKDVPPLQESVTGDGDSHRVTATFKTADVLRAEKFVIRRPVALRTVPVPFEFKDVKFGSKQTATLPARESR